MKENDIVDAIIETLENKKMIYDFHIIQTGRGVQIKTVDNEYINICMFRLDKNKDIIASKLR